MRRASLYFLALLGLFFLPVSDLTAGEIDPAFAATLKSSSPDDFITGIVILKDRVDAKKLEQSLLSPVRLPARVRHERVIRALQEKAETTQKALAGLLERRSEQGLVTDHISFWITNAMAVTAKPAVFHEIAAREEVLHVSGNTSVELIRPISSAPAGPNYGDGVEPGIASTNAPQLWAMGIKGQGAIVCNIDTGVDGNHPALGPRWRGHDPGVSPQESWFDPVTFTTFPKDFNGHGTHTMGTICGEDGTNQVGMAPEAKWIAAATIDRISIDQTKIDAFKSFEWCADPDNNPSTYDDVPCVASSSWGFSPFFHSVPKGWDFFYPVLDACDAAGCAVVFAAGNEGYFGGESLRTPSDRITSPVNVLSVGALNPDQKTRASFSSIGPSGVDHFTKKPEVMAHGDSVRSCKNGGGYTTMSGTSMACPHVAGAVGLLKSAFPEATAYEMKAALLYTAKDLGIAGEDNEYGRGIIDVMAAYNFLKQSLIGDTKELSITSKQRLLIFSLQAGAANANRNYLMVGSLMGSIPGTTLPGGMVLPINWDAYTNLTVIYSNTPFFQNFNGTLNANGTAVATADLNRPPGSALIGLIMTFAFCTMPPPGYDFVSNVWDVEITL
jgi:subtilisin family serine protease